MKSPGGIEPRHRQEAPLTLEPYAISLHGPRIDPPVSLIDGGESDRFILTLRRRRRHLELRSEGGAEKDRNSIGKNQYIGVGLPPRPPQTPLVPGIRTEDFHPGVLPAGHLGTEALREAGRRSVFTLERVVGLDLGHFGEVARHQKRRVPAVKRGSVDAPPPNIEVSSPPPSGRRSGGSHPRRFREPYRTRSIRNRAA